MRMGMRWLCASHLQMSSTNMHDPAYQDLSPLTWEADAKLREWPWGQRAYWGQQSQARGAQEEPFSMLRGVRTSELLMRFSC